MRYRYLPFLLLAACATANPRTAGPWTDFERLLVPQVRRVSGESTYDLVARTRPAFLRARTPLIRPLGLGEEMIGVYIDGHFAGGAEALRDISSDYVYSVRRISVADAGIRYGRNFRDGAIEVTLLRR